MILILAAGSHTRWGGRSPKQLVEIDGQPLIKRTVDQANRITDDAVLVITHDWDIQAVPRIEWVVPQFRRWTVETLLSTWALWQERTVVLLGDVIYSDEVIRALIDNDDPLAVYGFKWEIVGLTFSKAAWPDVIMALENARTDAERGGRGKLWEFYRSYCHIPLTAVNYLEDEVFHIISDFTNDIDTLAEYHAFMQANPWASQPKEMTDIVREYGA